MRRACRVRLVAGRHHKQYAAGAERQKTFARIDCAHTHSAGGVVTATAGHDDACSQSEFGRSRRAQQTTRLAALYQSRHLTLMQS